MARTEPRSYLRFVVDEWPLVDAIYERTRRGPLRLQTLYELADLSKTPNVIQRVIDDGIVVQLPNSPAFEMDEFVQSLIAHLKKEHTLGLANEIRVYLDDLDNQTTQMVAAFEAEDYDRLHRQAVALDSRIKTIQRQLAYKRMMTDVPKADVVVTNPTHLALALKYDAGKMTAPKVVAKGADIIAQKIKEIAKKHNVPIVEDKPLAQALYKAVDIGDEVPEKLFQAVAQVLAYIYKLRDKSTRTYTR